MGWRSRARCPRAGAGRRNTVSLRPRVQGLIPDQCCQIAEISVAELDGDKWITRAMDKHQSRIVCYMKSKERRKKHKFVFFITKEVGTDCRIYCDLFYIHIDITVLRFLLPNAVTKKFKFPSGRIFSMVEMPENLDMTRRFLPMRSWFKVAGLVILRS